MKVLVVLLVSLGFLAPLPAWGARDELPLRPYVGGELLVKYKAPRTLATEGRFQKDHGVEPIQSFDHIGVRHVKLPAGLSMKAALDLFGADPDVEYAEPNYYRFLSAVPNDAQFGQQWGLRNNGQSVRGIRGLAGADISAVNAWDLTRGANVVVAVIDSGADINHPDLKDNIWRNPGEIAGNGVDDDGNGYVDDVVGWDFFFGNNTPIDYDGHGTHVSGILGARSNNGIGVAGVNWSPKIMVLKFTGIWGQGTLADEIQAIYYANRMGARVINMSFSGADYSRAEQEAIAASRAVVVCSAGNDGTDNDIAPQYPANYPGANIIAVTASDQNDQLADSANYGRVSVDVAAPGTNILSTWLSGKYQYLNGTSMAAPFVSGIAALLISANPGRTAAQVIAVIKSTVDRRGNMAGRIATGGRVNAYRALSGNAPPPDNGGGGGTNTNVPSSSSSCFISTAGVQYPQWRPESVLGCLAIVVIFAAVAGTRRRGR